ncbi:MAG: hypothetical protein ACLTFB_01345 [Candidatus Phytoplasma pyri]
MEIKKNNPLVSDIDDASNSKKNKLIVIIIFNFVFIFLCLILSIWSLYKINEIKKEKNNLLSKLNISENSNIMAKNNNDVNISKSLEKIKDTFEQYNKDPNSSQTFLEIEKFNKLLKEQQEFEEIDKKNKDIFEKALQLFESENSDLEEGDIIDSIQENREQRELILLMNGFIKCCKKLDDFKETFNKNIEFQKIMKYETFSNFLKNPNHIISQLYKDIKSGREFLTFYANLLNILMIQKETQSKINSSSPYEKLILKSNDIQYNLLFKTIRKIIRNINKNRVPIEFIGIILTVKD